MLRQKLTKYLIILKIKSEFIKNRNHEKQNITSSQHCLFRL